MSDLDRLRTLCECCEGVTRLTPVEHFNRPGLPALDYRVGTHARFKSSMLAAIAQTKALRQLGTRQDNDFTIALIDSWAVTLDVLTFYQERIANEAYLRTALQRRSLLELARLIGYELNPGVAASTLLAFLLDGSEGSPPQVVIPVGTRAQSLPAKEEVPQTFETSEEYLARPEWSKLRPRLTYPQEVGASTRRFFVQGTSTALEPGDPVLLVTGPGGIEQKVLEVVSIERDALQNRTEVLLDAEPSPVAPPPEPNKVFEILEPQAGQSLDGLAAELQATVFSATSLQATLFIQGHTSHQLVEAQQFDLSAKSEPPKPGDPGLYALRVTAAPFGHNAPRYLTTPPDWRSKFIEVEGEDLPLLVLGGAFPTDWDAGDGQRITRDSQGSEKDDGAGQGEGRTIHLERSFDEILTEDWVVLSGKGKPDRVYQVESQDEESLADFGLSGKTTRVTLKEAPGAGADPQEEIENYRMRETTVHSAAELLPLAPLPIETIEDGTDRLELEESAPDLQPGHRLILAGQRLGGFEGVNGAEEVELKDVGQGAFTTLVFKSPLQFGYKRDTVTIYANVVPATHGESLQGALGSGDASQAFQRFILKKPPLTYVSAPVPSGGLSTLELRVDDVLWQEVPSFFELGPKDRNYVLRRDDEANTQVLFGDGRRGARLSTGSENVTTSHRSGIGTPGLVDADRITLLPSKPLGVREVTNPMATSGAQDPETRDQARENAPLTVLTLDRIVSLQDFEDFARAFSGIAKAGADWVWNGALRLVHVTVAGVEGADLSQEVLDNLLGAMDNLRDPNQARAVAPYQKLFFNLEAKIRVHPDYLAEEVLAAVEQALRDNFSFQAREFGQRVATSHVVAVMQAVEGVEAVDLDSLSYFAGSGGNSANEFGLPARSALFDPLSRTILPAQLLTLVEAPIGLTEMT